MLANQNDEVKAQAGIQNLRGYRMMFPGPNLSFNLI